MAGTRTAIGLGRRIRELLSRQKPGEGPRPVLFISPTGDFSNGAERSAYQLMKLLAEKGHGVLNAYPAYSPHAEEAYRAALGAAGVVPLRVPELRWWPDAPGGDINTPPDAPADLAAIDALREIIRAHAVGAVVTNTVNIYHGALAAAAENVRHIWLIHESPEGEFAYFRNKGRFISAHSDALFCVAGTLRQSLAPVLGGRRVGTFLPYTNPGDTGEGRAAGSPGRIVCIGLITKRKNQLELLAAYALLAEELKGLELVFVGGDGDDAGYRAACDEFLARNSLTRVTFTGHLENPWAAVSDRDIVVLPSSSETFGCVYAEALMCGVPVIASDNPGFSLVHRLFGAGRLYPRGDPGALAEAIREVLRDFESQKAAARAAAPGVRGAFAPENAYAGIVAEVGSRRRPRRKEPCDPARLNELIVKPS